MPALIKKPFEKWRPDDLKAAFGLKDLITADALTNWLSGGTPPPANLEPNLTQLRLLLHERKADWNEMELLNRFISPLLYLIDFSGKGFNPFSQRKLTANLGAYQLTGVVDWMAASGTYQPIAPYFFIHEYKRFKAGAADPLGQLLSSMLAAQTLNADEKPIYGCYVVAHIWTFVYLESQNYVTSQGFDATDAEELTIIWRVLQETKKRIGQQTV